MIKYCKILSFNKITHVVVAKYGDIQIQFTTKENIVESYNYIKEENSTYEIVDKAEYDNFIKRSRKAKLSSNDVVKTVENKKDDGYLFD